MAIRPRWTCSAVPVAATWDSCSACGRKTRGTTHCLWKDKRAKAWWGGRVKTTKSGESVSKDLTGTDKVGLPQMLPHAEVTAVSLEFGTLPLLEAFPALRAENWLHHQGRNDHPRAEKIKHCLLQAFHPGRKDWESSVLAMGEEVVERALRSGGMRIR